MWLATLTMHRPSGVLASPAGSTRASFTVPAPEITETTLRLTSASSGLECVWKQLVSLPPCLRKVSAPTLGSNGLAGGTVLRHLPPARVGSWSPPVRPAVAAGCQPSARGRRWWSPGGGVDLRRFRKPYATNAAAPSTKMIAAATSPSNRGRPALEVSRRERS